MTLRELLTQYPDKFYPQTWYWGEAFLDTDAPTIADMPGDIIDSGHRLPAHSIDLPNAAQLAALWLEHPDHLLWAKYMWCCDVDAQGQHVYVGQNGHGLEIHRHIHLTSRFGIPTW